MVKIVESRAAQAGFMRRFSKPCQMVKEYNHESATTKDFLAVQTEGKRQVERSLKHYNLDAIISVGYRVSTKRAVQFRQWATMRLREYLVQGYTLNQSRFDQNAAELQQALALIRKAARSPELSAEAGSGLVEIVSRYTQTFLWLQRYDEGLLNEPAGQSGGILPTEAGGRAIFAFTQTVADRAWRGDRFICSASW